MKDTFGQADGTPQRARRAGRIERMIAYPLIAVLRAVRLRYGTRVYVYFLKRWGVRMDGPPIYISSKTDLDGSDYSLIHLGEGFTISSYVRVLTHDWSPHTGGKLMGVPDGPPLGRTRGVSVGAHTFIGTGSIVMPGAVIGKGCIIGAGTVVRGIVPDYSIVIGSPGRVVGDSRAYMKRHFPNDVTLPPDGKHADALAPVQHHNAEVRTKLQ